jgi:hypothetical protein
MAKTTQATKWMPLFTEFLKHLKIQSKETPSGIDGTGTSLDLWGSQQRFLETIASGLDAGQRTFYCLKSRQLGITTISLAIDLFFLAMYPGTRGALIVDEDRNRDSFRNILKLYIDSFPPEFFGSDFTIKKGGNNKFGMKFSNNSQLDFIVAGLKEKESFGDGGGYSLCHMTEVGRYGCPDAINSFRQALSENNPNRLYIYESRAAGPNHWQDMWNQAAKDVYTLRRVFIGWWSHPSQKIERSDARYRMYGTFPPNDIERTLMAQVQEMYGHTITREQLAWYRWRASAEDTSMESMHAQQPWTEDQAFVESGHSFFANRLIARDLDRIEDPDNGETLRAFRYHVTANFFDTEIEELGEGSSSDEWQLRVWEKPVRGAKYVIGADPAFGRNDNKNNHCLHQDAEILTKKGWKKYTEIVVGDEAVGFDLSTGDYEYGKISDVIVKEYEGDLHRISNKHALDCAVTPEHRVVMRHYESPVTGRAQPWSVMLAEEATAGGNTIREIPIGGSPVGKGIEGLSLDMCQAIGWILTDGHVGQPGYLGHGARKGQKKIRSFIHLGQSVETKKCGVVIADEMRRIMKMLAPGASFTERVPSQPNRARQFHCRVGVQESEQFMNWLGDTPNRIPRRILVGGSREQLEALWLGILQGDGSWSERLGHWIKVSPGLDSDFADDVQELATKLGISATKNVQKAGKIGGEQWLVHLSKRRSHTFNPSHSTKIPYSGKVWCVTVPTGAFVARYRGRVFVTGNCFSVWRCFSDKLVQVAEYAADEDLTMHAAWVLAHLAGNYEDCIVNLEITGPGASVMQEFTSLRENLRRQGNSTASRERGLNNFLNAARWYLYARPDKMGPGYVYNFKTGYESKRWAWNQLKNMHASGELYIRSRPLCEEMLGVRVVGSDIGAQGRNNDDRVMAAALAAYAYKEWRQREMVALNETYEEAMLRESGSQTSGGSAIGAIMRNYLKQVERAEEEAELDTTPRTWMQQRGFA